MATVLAAAASFAPMARAQEGHSDAEGRKRQVVELLKSIEIGDPTPVEVVAPKNYIQHNRAVADGLEGFGTLLKQFPPNSAKVNTVRSSATATSVLGSDRGGETAAILMSILAGANRHRIEPFEQVRQLRVALSSNDVDLRSLLPDVWIAAHPEHILQYRRDEAEAAARARKRRREKRRAESNAPLPGG